MPEELRPPTPTEIAQATPTGGLRSYDEMNTGQMVFELQGTVGELKEAIASLTRTVERGFSRIDSVERTTGEIKEALRTITPKLEDLVGFAKHRAPTLADKADIIALRGDMKADLDKRPTRRQMLGDVAMIVGAIGTLLTIGAHVAR